MTLPAIRRNLEEARQRAVMLEKELRFQLERAREQVLSHERALAATQAELVTLTGDEGGGMTAKPRKRRRSGSMGSLKSALWATITYNR
jgi:hypothetical protein